ncbi:DNA alkylation repair protein [Arthrobacter sp. UYEF3]|uniref:DNA alkylation repair protein n=1 Tax=Arthrobacter sp. UYEF3 TaxID=1756365 RepID=UPI003390CF50
MAGGLPARGTLCCDRPHRPSACCRRADDAPITAQLRATSATDRSLLADVVEANLAESESFIRKAIGWALRDFSASDPDRVRAFVRKHGQELSPLSRREALRELR